MRRLACVGLLFALAASSASAQTLSARDRLGPGYDELVALAQAGGKACEAEMAAGPWGERCEAFRSTAFSVVARQSGVLDFCRSDLMSFMMGHGGSDRGYPDTAGCDVTRAALKADLAIADRLYAARRSQDPAFAKAEAAALTASANR